jgi:hypothetical protein
MVLGFILECLILFKIMFAHSLNMFNDFFAHCGIFTFNMFFITLYNVHSGSFKRQMLMVVCSIYIRLKISRAHAKTFFQSNMTTPNLAKQKAPLNGITDNFKSSVNAIKCILSYKSQITI